MPFKVLDAPALADDFYLNLLDWSSQNIISVGLNTDVYLWNSFTANVTKLMSLEKDDSVASVRWSGRGGHLAVGTTRGPVQSWEAVASKKLRTLGAHEARVGVLAWCGPLLASGSRDKSILLHDLRSKRASEHKLNGHKQEVRECGCVVLPLSIT